MKIGKENYDGAITGTVWKFQKDTSEISENSYIKKAGSFRINPNGFIKRFPLLPKEIKKINKQYFYRGKITMIIEEYKKEYKDYFMFITVHHSMIEVSVYSYTNDNFEYEQKIL